jgi:hypothetical protein
MPKKKQKKNNTIHVCHNCLSEGDPKGRSTVLVSALGSWENPVPCGHSLVIREGDPKEWSTVLVTALGTWGKVKEGNPKKWYMVLVTALGSWGKPVPSGHISAEKETL